MATKKPVKTQTAGARPRARSRRKRGDTKVKTLRLEYGESFLSEFRSNTRLDAVLKKRGVDSLPQLLKKLKA